MDKDKIYKILSLYQNQLAKKGRLPKKYTSEQPPTKEQALDHIFYMIIQTRDFTTENKLPKALKWLNFIQGSLWTNGELSFDDFKTHN